MQFCHIEAACFPCNILSVHLLHQSLDDPVAESRALGLSLFKDPDSIFKQDLHAVLFLFAANKHFRIPARILRDIADDIAEHSSDPIPLDHNAAIPVTDIRTNMKSFSLEIGQNVPDISAEHIIGRYCLLFFCKAVHEYKLSKYPIFSWIYFPLLFSSNSYQIKHSIL